MTMDSIMKLEESTPNRVPSNFESLVLNVFEEREGLITSDKALFGNVFTLENDLTVCIVLTVFLEKGFVLEKKDGKRPYFDRNTLKSTTQLPTNCRQKEDCCYKFDMYLPFLENYLFNVILVPLCGDTLVVNLIVRKSETIECCVVHSIKPAKHLAVLNQGVAAKFTNLSDVCENLAGVLERTKVQCLNAECVSNASLLGVPAELKEKIFLMLTPSSFVKVTATCKSLNSFAKDPSIWKVFLKRDFKAIPTMHEEYDVYKELYRQAREETPASSNQCPALEPEQSESSLQFEDAVFQYMSLALDL
ncbi:hypothetical protein AAG570_000460 [Ranatra chinensis]|uniref:F-box domain-containing protein n=1 Tax=Ranatra chinensis TaxID=642074 RepID=A0ABD0YXF3_9HEMI